MPWQNDSPFELRVRFVVEVAARRISMRALCDLFSISSKTGYKWLARYLADGVDGLRERTSAPKSTPHETDREIVKRLVDIRRQHPTWGPKKILHVAREGRSAFDDWPSASTVGVILKKHGLVKSRPRRHRGSPTTTPLTEASKSNDVWAIDFKGQFSVGKELCFPLTITDSHSRFLLCCHGLSTTAADGVRDQMERTFREFGLPTVIRSDNGVPFASVGAGGLTALSVWWILLGIRPERIRPGRPQQNGRHERMHLTLQQEVASPPRSSMRSQQRAFDAFRREYNEVRPHEALEMQTPSSLYHSSPRPFSSRLTEPEYARGCDVRRVRRDGSVRWSGQELYVSSALVGHQVGLSPTGDGRWSVHFGPVQLGELHEQALHLGLVRPGRTQWKKGK